MTTFPALSHVILVITAGTLLYVAVTDFREFKIRNELVVVLGGLFFVHALLSGRWASVHWNIGFAFAMFLILIYCYVKDWMGGGDLKILTVALLWVGLHCALVFAIFLALFGTLHSLAAARGWVKAQEANGRKRIPFAPSVAAALVGSFIAGCLQPVH